MGSGMLLRLPFTQQLVEFLPLQFVPYEVYLINPTFRANTPTWHGRVDIFTTLPCEFKLCPVGESSQEDRNVFSPNLVHTMDIGCCCQ